MAPPRRLQSGAPERMTSQHPTIGSLLRALRARNDGTLKEMSPRCGIPLSTLSKVEHDRLSLTYDKLLQISQRLNIRMSELFAEPDANNEPPVTARGVTRGGSAAEPRASAAEPMPMTP